MERLVVIEVACGDDHDPLYDSYFYFNARLTFCSTSAIPPDGDVRPNPIAVTKFISFPVVGRQAVPMYLLLVGTVAAVFRKAISKPKNIRLMLNLNKTHEAI